jgi:hypothetical protein
MTALEAEGLGSRSSRLVLKNVPQVKFFDGGPRCPEDIPFPSVMRALMEYLGAAIITGYDDGGDVLVGWSFFQNLPEFNAAGEFEPSGEFRKHDWFSYPPGFSFITISPKEKERPTLKETYRRALEWMLQVARTPVTFGDRHNGLAAYDAWAEHLLRDQDFPQDDGVLFQRHDVHNSVVGFVAEARWYGSQFLIGMTEGGDDLVHRDAIEDLYHAAALYAGMHGLMWQLWNLVGGIDNPDVWRQFADPTIRRQMVPIIHQAHDKDTRAAEHIERVLDRWR